ncbi:hypothetical protein CK203_085645 [Vitis vinifera]|uniref:Phytocyanin domain-containing protein n=1 Tax=Vitis vinifera TaxID=29760 RepID=A0A438BLJ9_VITVI|nr:hypothetical protein CK203_085645 [Vitis vinifera]
MASKLLNIALAVFAIVLPAVAMATEFTVGDDQVSLIQAAKSPVINSHTFSLQIHGGRHNVFKVNGTVFTNCTIPPPNEALTTGNDVITLATPGRKWYICGVNDHCANYGQKLAITVLEEWASPAPAPSPSTTTAPAPSSAYGISVSGY